MPHKDPDVRREYHRAAQQRRREQERERRTAEAAKALAGRRVWPESDLGWAAGLFEGEGTVSITRGGAAAHARCLATVTSTDRSVVDFFDYRWPGQLRYIQPRSINNNARTAWVWTVQGPALVAFLADLAPCLRTDRVKAKVALVMEAQSKRRQGSRDPNYRAMMEGYRLAIREMNRRGRS